MDESFRPPAIVGKLIAEGRRGLREGRGFYDWRKTDVAAYRTDALRQLLGMLRHHDLLKPPGAAL